MNRAARPSSGAGSGSVSPPVRTAVVFASGPLLNLGQLRLAPRLFPAWSCLQGQLLAKPARMQRCIRALIPMNSASPCQRINGREFVSRLLSAFIQKARD